MGVFDPEARMQPFGWFSPYGHGFDPDPALTPLEHTPRWWTDEAEAALRESVERWQWAWQHAFSSWFVEHVRVNHQAEGMDYAAARAKQMGLLDRVRLPVLQKRCLCCRETFREDGVAGSCLARYGNVESIDFCNVCMFGVISQSGSDAATKQDIVAWLQSITDALQRIPSQSFPSVEEFRAADRAERLKIVTLCHRRPLAAHVKKTFGSWLAALMAAGLLQDGTRRRTRGTQCIARDGHICFSLGEKTVDDFLSELGIAHEREPHYPGSNLRADFRIGGVLVEFLGLKGDAHYDAKTAEKQLLCKGAGLRLVLIEPSDLASRARLNRKLRMAVEEVCDRAE